MVAEGADGALALACSCAGRSACSRRRARAGRRWCCRRARPGRRRAASCRPSSAFSTLPSATTEVAKSSTIGGSPGPRHADAIGRGREPPLDAAEGRHQHAAGDVDEVDRDQAGRRRHLGPVADAADVAGVAQRDDGEAHGLALVDADLDRLRRDRLAEAVLAVDHRQHRRLGDDLDRAVGDERRRPPSIADSAARAARRGCRGRSGWPDADTCRCARPRLRAAGLDENVARPRSERARLDRRHHGSRSHGMIGGTLVHARGSVRGLHGLARRRSGWTCVWRDPRSASRSPGHRRCRHGIMDARITEGQ